MINLKFEKDLSQGITIIGSFLYAKCPWCDKCKEFLAEKGIQYTFIQADKKFFGSLMKITKSTQVPQIIINGEFIGDYDQLVEYFNKENDENS